MATAFDTGIAMNEDSCQNSDFSDELSESCDDSIADKNFEPSDDEKTERNYEVTFLFFKFVTCHVIATVFSHIFVRGLSCYFNLFTG